MEWLRLHVARLARSGCPLAPDYRGCVLVRFQSARTLAPPDLERSRCPGPLSSAETTWPPKFLGRPPWTYAERTYPGWTAAPRDSGALVLSPMDPATRTPAMISISGPFQPGLSPRCLRFAAHLPFGCATPRKTRSWLGATLYQAGLTPCGVSYEGFPSSSTCLSPFPNLLGAKDPAFRALLQH